MSLGFSSHAQDLQKYIDDFTAIVYEVPKTIYNRESCNKMISNLDDLSEDIEKVLNDNSDINPEDVKNLRSTKIYAEALEAFLRVVGNSSYSGYLKEKELSIVRELLDISIAQIYTGRFCANIYEIKSGSYKCLAAMKKGGNDIFKIKAQITSNSGNTVAKMDMGLLANQYRRIWSNANQLSNSSYKITTVECTITGQNNFGL